MIEDAAATIVFATTRTEPAVVFATAATLADDACASRFEADVKVDTALSAVRVDAYAATTSAFAPTGGRGTSVGDEEGDCVRDEVTVADVVGLGVAEGDCDGLDVAELLLLAPKDMVADDVREKDAVAVAVTVVDTEDESEEELEMMKDAVRETVTVAVGVGDGLLVGEGDDESDAPIDMDCDGVCDSEVLSEELGVGVRVTEPVID